MAEKPHENRYSKDLPTVVASVQPSLLVLVAAVLVAVVLVVMTCCCYRRLSCEKVTLENGKRKKVTLENGKKAS
jgi:hypothetical protein